MNTCNSRTSKHAQSLNDFVACSFVSLYAVRVSSESTKISILNLVSDIHDVQDVHSIKILDNMTDEHVKDS